MTHPLLTAAAAVTLAASTLWAQVGTKARSAARPAYAASQQVASRSAPGFVGAFGSGTAVRNLLY